MKIGYLDNSLTNYHYKKFYGILTGPLAGESNGVAAAWERVPSDEGKKWAAGNNIKYAASAEEVIETCDAIILLAPNNPELHRELARPALASGKPVFIDKMLADSMADAKEIVKLAASGKTPLMSSSSLRFATELEEMEPRITNPIEAVFARGLGKFPIYGVHTIAMALRYFGPKIKRVIDTGEGVDRMVTLDNGRIRASIELRESENQYEATPWQVGVRTGGKYEVATMKDFDGFYENLMRHTLEFFRTGNSPVSIEEQLAVVQVQEAAEESVAAGNTWVTIK